MTGEKDREDDDDKGGRGGGQTGGVKFNYKDIASTGPNDDSLPPELRKHKLKEIQGLHEQHVRSEKDTRQQREAIKQGQKSTYQYQVGAGYGMGGGGESPHLPNPYLEDKAYFAGTDKELSQLPNKFDAETNPDMQDDIKNRLKLGHQPKFHPKPRPM
jgi:hypothetical protein